MFTGICGTSSGASGTAPVSSGVCGYVDLHFKKNAPGKAQALYRSDNDEIFSKLPAGVRHMMITFRPTPLNAYSSTAKNVSYTFGYGDGDISNSSSFHPLMGKIARSQMISGGSYPAVKAKPFRPFSKPKIQLGMK